MMNHEEFYNQAYTQRIAVRAVIIDKEEKVLLQKMKLPNRYVWAIPGGIVNKGESLVEAVKREVLEETGVIIEPVCILGMRNWFREKSYYPEDPNSHFGTDIIFGAKYVSGEFSPQYEEGISEIKFCKKDELPNLLTTTDTPVLDYYKRMINDQGILFTSREDFKGFKWRYDMY